MINKKLMAMMNKDRKLMVIFGGMVLDGIILISLIVIAGVWFIL